MPLVKCGWILMFLAEHDYWTPLVFYARQQVLL